MRAFKLISLYLGIFLLTSCPAYAAGKVEIQPYSEDGQLINDAIGFRYRFYIAQNEGRDALKSISGVSKFRGGSSQNYSLETGIYSEGARYPDLDNGAAEITPAEASLRISLPYSAKSPIVGLKTLNPEAFPRAILDDRLESVSQLNLNAKQGRVEIARGETVTDKSGWGRDTDLADEDYIQWDITVELDSEERRMALALPKEAASSLASGAPLSFQGESLYSSGTFKVYYWDIEIKRASGMWEALDKWRVSAYDGSQTDYGARKAKYDNKSVIEISNDGPQGEFLKEGEILSLAAPEDAAPPSGALKINSGAEYTNSRNLTLSLSAADDIGLTGYYISEEPSPPAKDKEGWVSISSVENYNVDVSYSLKDDKTNSNSATLYVWYKDFAGNISETAADSIGLDTASPQLEIKSPTTASTFSTKEAVISLSGTASDSASGIEKIIYSGGQGAGGAASGSEKWSIPGIRLSKGKNVFTLTAYDKVNNSVQATIEVNCEITEPPEAPVFSQKYAGKEITSGNSLSWSWAPAQGGGAPEEYWVSPSWLPNGFLTKDTAYSPNKKLGKGTYWLSVMARNSAGLSQKAKDIIIIVDEKGSKQTASASGTGETSKTNTVSSATSATDTSVSADTKVTTSTSKTASTNTDNEDTKRADSENDSAPNASIIINDGADYTNSSALTIFLLADDDTGVRAYYLSESSSAPKADSPGWIQISQSEEYSGEIIYEISGREEEIKIYCWVKDSSGNVSDGASDSITLDKTNPEISITSHSSGEIEESEVNLSGNFLDSEDGSGVIKVSLKNSLSLEEKTAGLDNESWSAKMSLEKGSNEISVTAEDAAGNTASAKVTLEYSGEEKTQVSESNVRSDIINKLTAIREMVVDNQEAINDYFTQDASKWDNFINYNGYFSAAFEEITANGWNTTESSFNDDEKNYIFSKLGDIIEETSFLKDAKKAVDLEVETDEYRAAAIREIIYQNFMDVYNEDFSKHKSDIAKTLGLSEDEDNIISKIFNKMNVLFILQEKAYDSDTLEARVYNVLKAVPESLYSQPLVISSRSESVYALIENKDGAERGLARINVAADFDVQEIFHQLNGNIWDNITQDDSREETESRGYELISQAGLRKSNYLAADLSKQCGESTVFSGSGRYCFIPDSELKITDEDMDSCGGYVSDDTGQYCVNTSGITYADYGENCSNCFIFYYVSPREFLPYIGDGWLNTEELFNSALSSFNDEENPRREPMNQFLFFADLYSDSKDGETTRFYSSDKTDSLSRKDIPLVRDTNRRITSLTIDKMEHTFTWDEDGNVDTVSSSEVLTLAPEAETVGSEDVTDKSVTLKGKVNANNSQTSAWFEYRKEDEEEYQNSSDQQTVVGKTAKDISMSLTGLSPLTRYYYRIAAKNEEGSQYGGEEYFETLETEAE